MVHRNNFVFQLFEHDKIITIIRHYIIYKQAYNNLLNAVNLTEFTY